MKRNVFILLIFLTVSLACQTVQFAATETPEAGIPAVFPTSTPLPVTSFTSTPRPIPEPVTCTDDSCLNACLQRINQTIPTTTYEPLTGAYAGDNIDLNLVYYKVKDGQLEAPQMLYVPDDFKAYQEDLPAHQNIWMYASGLLPPEDLKWLVGFEIFSSSNYAGWVQPSGTNEYDRSKWILGMEITAAQDPVDLTYILVHEYGHLITLNTDQIPPSDYYAGWPQNLKFCPQFLSPDGCSKPDSYLNLFYQKFWKGPLFESWLEEVEKPHVDSSDEFRALVETFYEKHPEQFVREYAATNLHEDIAESFMHFVLEPKPTGNGVVDQKIRFFYDFPEMVALRQTMIQNVCSYTQ
jgi:hypothetical protein